MERAKSTKLVRAAWVLTVLGATACASQAGDGETVGQTGAALTAYCKANVNGVGTLDVETNYLPHVVHCENGGAPLESLKAQAVAARTYLYYKLETSGSISDGQGDQVYSCGSQPDAMDIQAVKDTEGIILRYNNTTVCSFFVAGGAASPPACHGGAASTEGDVTYNEGLSGSNIHQTPLGSISPSNYRNRGCMSQLGSRCLANEGKNFEEILHFYYGADIGIEQATGPCVTAPPTPDAGAHKDGAAGGKDGGAGGGGGGSGGGGAADEAGVPIGSGGGGGGAGSGDGGDENNAFPGDSGSGGCSAAGAPLHAGATGASFAPLALLGLALRRRRSRRA